MDYQTSEYQNSLFLFNVAPCAHPEIDVEGNDYKGNVHKKRAISSPAFFIAVVIYWGWVECLGGLPNPPPEGVQKGGVDMD